MQIEKYLKENQPVIYKTFYTALKENKLSHAYLLSGDPGTPLLEVATFLAKSIICDDPTPFACNNCITCLRIESDNYPDFIVVDGSKDTIKKDDLQSIENQFTKQAFEVKGIMIYILHLIENTSPGQINTILKFLEEPAKNVYAFLTTNNESRILQTIISRCQTLHLKLIDRKKIIKDSVEMGVSLLDAELLSIFYNNAELILNAVNDQDNQFHEIKPLFELLIQSFTSLDKRDMVYTMQKKVIPYIKEKAQARMFLDFLSSFFQCLIKSKNHEEIMLSSYDTIINEASENLPHIEESLIEILKCRNLINYQISLPLLFDHLIITITKEEKYDK